MNYVGKAPGKALLFGDYAVLEGAPALVAATDCVAEARFVPHAQPHYACEAPQLGLTGEWGVDGEALVPAGNAAVPKGLALAALLLEHHRRRHKLPYGTLHCDTQAFYQGRHKLGLGSSAALTVAASAALRAACGEKTDADALDELAAVHAQAQGGAGSGVDVAAALLGGVVRYQLPDLPGSHGLRRRLAVPAGPAPVHLVFVYTGRSAATPPYLTALFELKARSPRTYWARLEPLASLSAAACEVWALGHTQALLPMVGAYADALGDLGEVIGMPIFSPAHRSIAEVVQSAGGAYKPSGAGGGDVGVAFCADARTAQKVRAQLRRKGHVDLPVQIAVGGVHTTTTDKT